MKKLLSKYQSEKSHGDSFFSWYFTKHASPFVKYSFILLLWILYLRFAFDLVFMVTFFKIIFLFTVVFGGALAIIKIWKFVKR